MKTPKRGLTDIRTLSGRVSKTHQTSRAYMQVTCLEMEKVRLQQELESALRRAESIQARLAQIDDDKSRLLRTTYEVGGIPSPARKAAPAPTVKAGMPVGLQAGSGFKFRY